MAVIATQAALSPLAGDNGGSDYGRRRLRGYRKALYPQADATADPDCPDEIDLEVAQLGAVAAARVERYAPMAPQVMRDEAVMRLSGYLTQRSRNRSARSTWRALVSSLQRPAAGSCGRLSTAAPKLYLAPFARRRALPVESDS